MFASESQIVPNSAPVAAKAENQGWIVNRIRDLCPECAEKERKKAA